jgi:hypothetical protein
MSLETSIDVTMTVAAGLQKISHLIQTKAEPLCCLDHPKHGDGLGWIEPMTAGLRAGSASRPRRS